ncbi:MAG: hypothetical protein PWQ06_332 [Anaerophaga sp.]|nr:hypothetical protein [Anaerophaga sp.]
MTQSFYYESRYAQIGRLYITIHLQKFNGVLN